MSLNSMDILKGNNRYFIVNKEHQSSLKLDCGSYGETNLIKIIAQIDSFYSK